MVKIDSIDIFRAHLDPEQTLPSGHHSIAARTGLLLRFTTTTGKTGWGETSPLPGTSQETIFEAELQWVKLANQLSKQDIILTDSSIPQTLLTIDMPLYASVRTGLDMVIWDLLNDHQDTPIPVNALLKPLSSKQEIIHLLDNGYKSLKLKIGRQSFKDEQNHIRLVQELIKNKATLRLDANRAWAVDEALAFLSPLDPEGIEYIEEPLQHLADYPLFLESTPVPVALDESLQQLAPFSPEIPDGTSALILKPTHLGGFYITRDWITYATKTNRKWILTHCFESPVGLSHLLSWARHWGCQNRPMGLDASMWSHCSWLTRSLSTGQGRIKPIKSLDSTIIDKHLERILHVS